MWIFELLKDVPFEGTIKVANSLAYWGYYGCRFPRLRNINRLYRNTKIDIPYTSVYNCIYLDFQILKGK